MNNQNINPEEVSRLRQKAEEQLNQRKSETIKTVSESDMLKLIHELEVHQIELEMQNEELTLANSKAKIVTEKYEELYDFAPSGYFTLSREGTILELNLQGALMLGKERSFLINNQFAFFVKEDLRLVFSKFLEEILQGKGQANCDLPLISSTNINLHVFLTGIMSENHEHYNITAVDITEKKLIEKELFKSKQKLEESELKYRIIFDKSLVSIIVADDQGNYLSANNSTSQLLGYSIEEILEMNVRDLKTKAMPNAEERYLKYLEKGEERGEFEFISKSGENKIAKYLSIRVKKDFNLSMMIDITEQKEIENNLIIAKERAEESEKKYKSLYEKIYRFHNNP